MPHHPLLHPGSYYHIYNRVNLPLLKLRQAGGKEDLFREEANYHRFLTLYDKRIKKKLTYSLAESVSGNN